jgi:hypothetical protein
MNNAARQAITTEMTIGGLECTGCNGHFSEITEIAWNNFYNMILSTA